MYRIIKIAGGWTAIEMSSPRTALLRRKISDPTTRYLNDSIDILSDLPINGNVVCLAQNVQDFCDTFGLLIEGVKIVTFSDQKIESEESPCIVANSL